MKKIAGLIGLGLWMLMSIPAGATPDPAIHITLKLIGFNHSHYFTMAKIVVQPGYGEEMYTDYDYLLAHNPAGTIAEKILLRETFRRPGQPDKVTVHQPTNLSAYIKKHGISRRWREQAMVKDRVRERDGDYYLARKKGAQRLFSRQEVEAISLSYRQALPEVLAGIEPQRRAFIFDNSECGCGEQIEAKKIYYYQGRKLFLIHTGDWCTFALIIPVK
jgi:hypothetical protein